MKILMPVFLVTFLFLQNSVYSQTQVLVLGTTHLNQTKGVNAEILESTLEKLNTYDFAAIAIEQMPTELLYDIQSREDSTYYDVLESFGGHRLEVAEKYQNKLSVDYKEAVSKANDLLSKDFISGEERVLLIQNLLAAGDLASAVLQYQYLNTTQSGSILLEQEITEKFKSLSNSASELYSLGVKLAQKEELQRLEYIDNFQDEPLLYAYFPAFISDYMSNQEQFKEIGNLPVFKTVDSLQVSGVENQDFLPLFKYLNSKEYQSADYKAQWEIWLNTKFPSKADKSRFALWEMRNLQIAANIMKVAAFYPDQKILVVIGASHKSFLEKHLSQMPDLELLEFD